MYSALGWTEPFPVSVALQHTQALERVKQESQAVIASSAAANVDAMNRLRMELNGEVGCE